MFRIFSIFAVTFVFGLGTAYAEDATTKMPAQNPIEKHQKVDGERLKGKVVNIEELFKARDVDGDGKLSKEELLKDAPEAWKAVIEKRFAAMDTDHDGFITLDELKAAFEKFKERHEKHEKDVKVGKDEKIENIEKVEKTEKVENTKKAEE
jgi:hypothetical protein